LAANLREFDKNEVREGLDGKRGNPDGGDFLPVLLAEGDPFVGTRE